MQVCRHDATFEEMPRDERTTVTVSAATAEKLALLVSKRDFETPGDAVGYAVNRVLIDDGLDS